MSNLHKFSRMRRMFQEMARRKKRTPWQLCIIYILCISAIQINYGRAFLWMLVGYDNVSNFAAISNKTNLKCLLRGQQTMRRDRGGGTGAPHTLALMPNIRLRQRIPTSVNAAATSAPYIGVCLSKCTTCAQCTHLTSIEFRSNFNFN